MPSVTSSENVLSRVAFWLAGSAAVSVLFSIAACNILIALALAALFFSRTRLRIPPIRLPLALFMLGTLISLLVSGDAVSGRPQVIMPFGMMDDGESQFAGKRVSYTHASEQLAVVQILRP